MPPAGLLGETRVEATADRADDVITMNEELLLGVDLGSTTLKAVAFEAGSGAALASSGGPLPYERLPRGGCELAESAIAAALFDALADVAAQLGPRAASLRAIGCAGHGAGLYALGADARLLRHRAVASTDQRAAARARALARTDGDSLFEEVGCGPWPGQPTLIAAQLIEEGLLRERDIARLLFAKDYVAFLLTGEIATDASDASTAGLLSLATGRPAPRALAAAGLQGMGVQAIAPVVPSGTVVGRLRTEVAARCGLPALLPVTIGSIDLLASMFAVGAAERGTPVSVLGTWSVNATTGAVREPKPPVGGIVDCGEPGRRLYLENSPSSMANLAWLARTLGFDGVPAVIDSAMGVPLGAGGLRFLPFINGGGPPRGATAGFVGLNGEHDRRHLARAAVDAVAALHARHLGRLAACGLVAPGELTALGGGARDKRLVQLLASFVGRPVRRCGDDETGARGAARHAARSVGLETAGAPGVLPVACDTVDPVALDEHAEFFAGFNDLVDGMQAPFDVLAKGTR